MKYIVQLGGTPYEIHLEREANELYASLNGKRMPVRVEKRLGQSILTLNVDGKNRTLALSKNGKGYRALSLGRIFDVQLERSTVSELRQHLKSSGQGSAVVDEIKSHMPGLIVQVEVEVGQHVTAGDGLIIIEAMKMENEIRAPHDGVVEKIAVEEGLEVKGGQLLCIVKPDENED